MKYFLIIEDSDGYTHITTEFSKTILRKLSTDELKEMIHRWRCTSEFKDSENNQFVIYKENL